jgi:hypothetical protein
LVVNVYVGETKVFDEFSPLIRKLYLVFGASDVSETFAAITSAPVNAGVVGAAVRTEEANVGLVENSIRAVVLRFSGLIAILTTALELVTASSDLNSTVGAE